MGTTRPPLLCFAHVRWDFVWQRPQHLMSRFARDRQQIIGAVEAALHETSDAREARIERERRVLTRSSWDAIAAQMDQCMEAARKESATCSTI